MTIRLWIILGMLLSLPLITAGQQLSRDQIVALLEKNDCITVETRSAKVCKYDYQWDGKKIEGITIRPLADGKYPGLLLLSGMSPAANFINFGLIFAEQGSPVSRLLNPALENQRAGVISWVLIRLNFCRRF